MRFHHKTMPHADIFGPSGAGNPNISGFYFGEIPYRLHLNLLLFNRRFALFGWLDDYWSIAGPSEMDPHALADLGFNLSMTEVSEGNAQIDIAWPAFSCIFPALPSGHGLRESVGHGADASCSAGWAQVQLEPVMDACACNGLGNNCVTLRANFFPCALF